MPSVESSFDPTDPTDLNGPLTTDAYICPSQGAPFELRQITLPSLGPTMIEADVIMNGLCHTDISMRDNDWGVSDYPFCGGHEGVARVRRIGSAVRNIKVGDRVAIAWIRDSCRVCDPCLAGRENICENGYQGTYLGPSAGPMGKSELKYNAHGGCFARVQRIEERFAVKIPDSVPSEIACPLLCGGGTMYEPLCNYGGPNVKVGIGSIGGLGTAGIKLGRLRGCIIYALSSSEHKRESALAAGANVFVNTTNEQELKAHTGKLDVVIDTLPLNSTIGKYMQLLKAGGVLVRTGIPKVKDGEFTYNFVPLIFQQKSIVGTVVTGTRHMTEMLDLVSHNLEFMKSKGGWDTEHVPMSEVNDVMHKLSNRQNKGYRYVLEW